MFKYNNTHIFTGYLKQLLSTINLPTCKIYTQDFARYYEQNGKEDPRVLESFDTPILNKDYPLIQINYLKNNELFIYQDNLLNNNANLISRNLMWKRISSIFYDCNKSIPGLTKTLKSPGNSYDKITHEYLGEYLRFLRDYYDINLMSLYNCFNNTLCNNILSEVILNSNKEGKEGKAIFDSQDTNYRIYAIPVKLFSDYTIAIDSCRGVEMFCGFYSTSLDNSAKAKLLETKTYVKVNKTFFGQPFLFDKLNVKYWPSNDLSSLTNSTSITRWDIAKREHDLKLFIKIPVSCKSSIVILEGNYRHYNDFKYIPAKVEDKTSEETFVYKLKNNTVKYEPRMAPKSDWFYKQNHSVVNFGSREGQPVDTNASGFNPISKLQLLAFNTGESYPFADRLIEYLVGSAITPNDKIPDNIRRVQRVMNRNGHYFKIEGLWENKIQKIIYDYIMNAGPVEVSENLGLIDRRRGYHASLGQTSKSTLYDVLGFVDKDAEKWYASWTKKDNKPQTSDSIQSVDIYDGLYDI